MRCARSAICSTTTYGLLLVPALWLLLSPVKAFSQTVPRKPAPEQQRQMEKDLATREDSENGIYISSPKVYDDSSLQVLLSAARAQLVSVQSINQGGLLAGIGAITGASSTQTSFSGQVSGGPAIPQLQTVSNGATSQQQTVTGTPPVTTTTNTQPNQVITSTTAPPTAPTASLPTSSGFSSPASFAVNALGALNEQMQLTYEIANLSLLLEGSLSDRFVRGTGLFKTRTTLGFSLTINAPKKFKDAVAVVEVEVGAPTANLFVGPDVDPPTLKALLPREKTYNVAAITNKMASVGGGIVTQVIGGSFSFLHGKSTYYVVQDQDTVAQLISPSDPSKVAFGWQFRPVLGQPFVQSGMRQTFAQLTMPLNAFAGCFGETNVRTYWRRFDRKKGAAGPIIPGSLRVYPLAVVPVFDLRPTIQNLNYEDLGAGQVEVKVYGDFLDGTYVRVSNTYLRLGSPGFTFENKLIRFVAAANDLVKNGAQIVTRDGSEVQILNPLDPDPIRRPDPRCSQTPIQDQTPLPDQSVARVMAPQPAVSTASIESAQVTTYDDTNSVLTVRVENLPALPLPNDYLLNIGNHVFGLSDAPISREVDRSGTVTFSAIVPTVLIAGVKAVNVQPLFWNTENWYGRINYKLTAPISDLPIEGSTEKIVLIGKDVVKELDAEKKPDKDGKPALKEVTYANFMLTGNRLENAKVIMPSGVQLCCVGSMTDLRTLRLFRLTLDDWKNYKGIVLEKTGGERPEFLALPAPDDKTSTPPTPILTPKYRITVGMDDAALTGSNLDKLKVKAVTYNKKPLNAPTVSADGKTMTLTGLVAAGVTTEPVTRDIEFEFEGGQKTTVTLDVVNSKIETAPKN